MPSVGNTVFIQGPAVHQNPPSGHNHRWDRSFVFIIFEVIHSLGAVVSCHV